MAKVASDRRRDQRPGSPDRRQVPRLAAPPRPAATGEESLPPGPRAPAFVQTMRWILRPVHFMESCRRRYGDAFTARLGPRVDVVFLADPATVKEVLQGDPELMRMGDINGLFRPILGSNSLLLLDGDRHLRQRRLILPQFHGQRVERYEQLMTEIAEREVASWPEGQPFELAPRMRSITLHVILRAVFGMEAGPRRDELRVLLARLLHLCQSRATMLPQLRHELGGRSPLGRLMRCVREVDEALYEEIDRRRSGGGTDRAERDDVLSLLLAARDQEGQPMSDRELRDQLLTLLVAGHETTANALAWAFERLVHSPESLTRLRQERDRGEDAYLDAVIKETLRLRPVLPIVARKLSAPFELDGRRYPAGAVLMPCVYLVHHNEQVYERPREFRPERWLGPQPSTYAWIPFGGGMRRCLGASFALMEMHVVLRAVLGGGELRAADRRDEPIKRRSFTFAPRRGAAVVLTRPRSPSPRPAVAAASGA